MKRRAKPNAVPFGMRVLALLSVGLFYLGAMNTVLARVAGTCTQRDADRLFGVVISITLYGLALLGLWLSARARAFYLFLVPLVPIVIWQAWFSARLTFEISTLKRSACSVLEGAVPGYPMSGSEAFFAITWPMMSFGVLVGLSALLLRHPAKDHAGQ
ncbi:MAG: hypothetical protein AAF914_07775 [Pseudomonadota bacterium]